MNLDIDRLTILSRNILYNNTLRAHALSKALEPCVQISSWLSLNLIYKYWYTRVPLLLLSVHLHNWGNPSYHNPLIMRCIKPRDHKHIKYKWSQDDQKSLPRVNEVHAGLDESMLHAGSQTHAPSYTNSRAANPLIRTGLSAISQQVHRLQAIPQPEPSRPARHL